MIGQRGSLGWVNFPVLLPELFPLLGKRMSEICASSVSSKEGENQCAHFVSHVLSYNLPNLAVCKTVTLADKRNCAVRPACIRVNEVFNRLSERGPWSECPALLRTAGCMIFVTDQSNVRHDGAVPVMGTHRQKHVGIFTGDYVWHYSNSAGMVTRDHEADFIRKFKRSYGDDSLFFYGKLLA